MIIQMISLFQPRFQVLRDFWTLTFSCCDFVKQFIVKVWCDGLNSFFKVPCCKHYPNKTNQGPLWLLKQGYYICPRYPIYIFFETFYPAQDDSGWDLKSWSFEPEFDVEWLCSTAAKWRMRKWWMNRWYRLGACPNPGNYISG